MECRNCKHITNGKYCSNCGQPTQFPRIDFKYILQEIGSALSFKKGILFTIKELLIRPGPSIKSFILEDRNRLVKPILFIIFCSFVYAIIQELLHFEDAYFENAYDKVGSDQSAILVLFEWIRNNYGYANILMGVFMALALKILFWKYDYNLFELLILLLYLTGVGMLIYSILGIVETFSGLSLFFVSGFIVVIYTSWGIGQFFGKRNFMNYIKGLLSYLLGFFLFSFSAVILGMTIDAMIN